MIKRFFILLLAIVASVGMSWATTTDLASITDNYTAQDGEILTGTLGVNVKISIADGATVTLLNANINGDKTWTTGEYAGLTCLGDATITIVGKNSVSGFSTDNGYPGIYVPSGKTLIINGTGSLTAQSSTEEAAGIGARKDTHCGNIEIQSGKITAIASGEYGAGIGGAYNASCGDITISGGIVTAVGGDHCAGIGGGRRGASTNAGHCGNILISGGVVSATSGKQAAAIGGGRGNNNAYKSNCGTITITNTALKVYAEQGGEKGSTNTIGAGKYNNCGAVTIGGNTGVINDDPYTYRTKEDGEIVVVYINAIGTVVYTQECKDKIDIARELYDALEDSQKDLVTNYQTLLDAEAAYAALIPQPAPDWVRDGDTWDNNTKTLTVNSNTGDNAYASKTDIKHLIVGDAVTELGWGTFFFDSLMTTVELGNNLEIIGISAFNECRSLSTITVPASVTNIKVRAFRNCTSLTTFTCEAVTPPTIGNAIFENDDNLTAIYVPAASVDAYKSAWSDYASLIEAIGGGSAPATDPIVITTTTGQSSYTQGSITVSVDEVGDSDGFYLNDDKSASISNSGSSTISKIELVPGWFLNKHDQVRANGAEPNSSSEELITFLNVNSNEVTLSCPVAIYIKEVRIYFEEDGGGSTPTPTGLQVTELQVPASWQDNPTMLSTSDMPGFVAITEAEAAAWDAAPAGNVVLIFAFEEGNGATALSFKNGVYQAAQAHNITYEDLYAWSVLGRQIFYTGGGSTPDPDPTPTPTPSGDGDKLAGAFSVGGDKVVYFSKANLQATTADNGSTWTWGFAENQWDYVGNSAANNAINGGGTVSTNGPVDLFAWSSTDNNYFGINNSINEADYSGDFKDWGAKKGSDWRTLTINEWQYLLQERNPGSSSANHTSYPRYTNAQILTDGTAPQKDIKGIILFPDDFNDGGESIDGVTWGSINPSFFSSYPTTCTTAGWATLESMGCVFLPSAGSRQNFGDEFAILDVNQLGNYWSSTLYSGEPEDPQSIAVGDGTLGIGANPRYWGKSVRLVSETAPSPAPAGNLKLIEFQVPASWENDHSPITSADFPDLVATTYEIASALPVPSDKPSLVVFDFPGDDEVSVYSKMGGQVSGPSTGTIYRNAVFEQSVGYDVHYFYTVHDEGGSSAPTEYNLTITQKPMETIDAGGLRVTIHSEEYADLIFFIKDISAMTLNKTYELNSDMSKFYCSVTFQDDIRELSAATLTKTENAGLVRFTGYAEDSHHDWYFTFDYQETTGGSTPTVTWNSSNISNLTVNGSSYSKEGVTLSPNASNNYAYWLDYGDESQNGVAFYVNATGGHTFSNSLGKNFTKIEMTLNGSTGWYLAYLGSGWNIDGMKVIWTGNASTVDLLTETSSFGGAATVKSIVFYFEGGSEEPGGGSTDVIPCTAEDLGKVLCTDGSIYATVSEASAASKTAVAMIAYVDTENGKALALALADDGDEMNWATAKTTAAAHTPAVSGGTWTLASKDDWNNMITAAGSYTALRDGFSGVGGTNMLVAEYWTSTAGTYSGTAIGYRFQNGKWTDPYVDDPLHVRACLAFDIPATPAYETVMNLINEIPNPVVLTAECKAKIDAARTAYDALSDGDKDLVTNIATLTTAEAAFDNVMDIWLSGDCDAILWKDTTLTVRKHAGEGNGAMADYNYMSRAPWYSSHWYDPKPNDIVIKSVTIEEGVTHLGDYAFAWMSEMKTVTIPSSVTTIPEDAFYWSKAVDDIYLTVADPSNLTWALPYSADNQFKPEKATLCHVPADLLTAYQEKFGTINMTFVGDLAPVTPPTPEEQAAIDAVKAKISAIPQPVVYTEACKAAIDSARAAYDALATDVMKLLVDNYDVLTAAETTYANLKDVVVVEAKINELPNPMTEADLKLSVYQKVQDARAAYDALTADQKALVGNYSILTAAEAAFAPYIGGGTGVEGLLTTITVSNSVVNHSVENIVDINQDAAVLGENGWTSGKVVVSAKPGFTITKVESFQNDGWIGAVDEDTSSPFEVSITNGMTLTKLNVYGYEALSPIAQAQAALALINAIPDPVTLDEACVKAIKDARAAVDALGENAKLIDAADMAKLTDAEAALTALNQAEADKVVAKINNIPLPVELKLATRDSIQNARAAYDALNAAQQALVTNYPVLTAAEAALAALNPGGGGMPTGALSGKFSINADGGKIAFSKGNLQATTEDLGEHWTWGFAANQWEVIGSAGANTKITANGTVSENGTVDLFGWSTPMTYYGIHNSTNSDYYSDDFREWGENITGATWKTLSPSDWIYIISTRADAAQKQGPATVNGVNGYIFLPDEWVLPSGLSFTASPNNWTANVYDGDDWTAMENAGAVFLPKSSWRKGNTVTALAYGYYWSSDYNNYSNAMAYYFKEDLTITGTGIPRYAGIYVRLVTEDTGSPAPLDSAQAVKDLIDAISVPVTLKDSDAIQAARAGYEALAEATKHALDDATVQKLLDAEAAYAALIQAATDVIALINAIPQPVIYNEACGDSIAAARNAYDALSDELKPLVTNYPVLTDAEATYEALAPRIWTSGDCQVIYWPGDSAMIVSKLPGEGNGVMDNYANKNSVPWVDYQLKVKTLTIESGVTEIGSCAFYELRNLEGGLVIPEGVTAIHENGFRNSLKLTSITLPSTITLLGDNADAFNNCKAANISITADPNKLAWNEDFDDFIYSYTKPDVHKTTVCHVPVDFYEIYVAKFDTTVNVTFVGDLPAALSPAEHAAIDAVKDSIAAIGAEISYPESGAAIDAARSAYDALDDDLMPFVSNYQTLLDAEDAYADAKQAHDAVAAAVVDKINAIPVPVEYSSKAAIDTARVAYDALLGTQKALVPDSILQKLTDAEATWAAIAAKVEHNVSYMGKDGELKNEKVALLHIPDPAPEFNGYEFVRWDVKAGDFLEEGLRIKAIYTPIITTNPQGFDTLAYNGLAQELVKAGVAKEGHIEYSLYPEEPESWSAELPKATIAGVYAIYYKLVREGHADYIAPEPTMATIAKVPVTYVAPTAVESLVYTASNQTLIAAGQTQDGTFEYSLDPNLLDSWSAELPQAMAAGTYSVYYRVQGDLNHLDSTAVDPIAVTIAKEELTATADDKNVIYGDAVPAYTVTYAGWQGDDDATVLTGELAFACEYASTSNVGEYTITPSGVDAANYNITFVNGKVTVAKAESGCIAPVVYDTLVYNGANQTLIIAGQPMGGEMQYSLDTTVLDCWSTSLPQAKDAGTYNVYYRVKGDMNHNDHYYDLITVSIAKAALTVTAEDKNVVYGDAVPEYTVTYAGWHGTDDASVLTGTIAFACTYAPTSNVGDYTITPSGVDAANYAIQFINGKVTVNQAPLMITADDKNVIYGEVAPAFTASYSGWKNNDDESVVSGLTLTSEYLVTSNVGTYDIVPANASAMNYAISYTNGTLTVNQAALTITANDTTMIYGDEHPEFTVTYAGWKNSDDESVVSGLQFSTPYAPGSYIGTYAINPNSATALNYAITFVDGTLTVNKAHVYVSDAEAQIAKFADGHANAVVLEQGVLNGIKLNDPIAHVTTAAFSSADVAENLTITLFYELTGDAALLNNYNLDPTSDIFTTEGVIIEPFIPDNEEKPEDEEAKVNEGIEIYAYGYCDGSGYSLKYHLESGNPDQYKIDFEDSRFTDVDWTNLVITGKDGTIDIEIPVDLPTGDYTMTVYFRDSRFDWLESRQFNVTFHVNLPETYVRPLFDNVIALVDTCHCLTDIQWYWRANSTELWQPIEGANGYYYHVDGKLTGEYFVYAKMNGEPTYTCGQTDMETLYGETQKASAPVVKAYPNPVVTTTTVTIENSTEWIHSIRIVNLMGAEVMNDTFEGDKTSVEMGNYPQGNYMISVDGIVVKVMKK